MTGFDRGSPGARHERHRRSTIRIVDISAIADCLNVPKDTVNKWRHRGILPPPDYDLTVGPVWNWTTIETWARETGRL